MNNLKKPVLWNFFLSSSSWRVRIALNLKNVDYEYKSINLIKGNQLSEEFKEINSKQEVPVLQIDNTILFQSLPIIEYLNETRKSGINYLPSDPIKRAKARAIAELVNSGIQPYQNISVVQQVLKEMGKSKRDEWLQNYLGKGFDSIESILKETSESGQFCVGQSLSIADICLVPQVYSAKRFKIDFAKYPLINSINSNLEAVPQFIKAHAHNQIDTSEKFKSNIK